MEKEAKYLKVIENLEELYANYNKEELALGTIARMASISSAIKREFTNEFTFVGFYIVVKSNEIEYLEIGPYVSHIIATPRIAYAKGVCGTTWAKEVTIIENDVRKCDNYIACSLDVLSEIVVPAFIDNKIVGVLDIDSRILNYFDELDKKHLELILSKFV